MVQVNVKEQRILKVTLAAGLGLVLLILFLFDINNAIRKSLVLFENNQNILAHVLMKSAVEQAQNEGSDLIQAMILNINENYPTSSSMYCIFSKDDEILFLKDENTSSTLIDEKMSNYFNENNRSSRDEQKYIISKVEREYGGANYELVICTKENYIIKKIKLDEMRLHCLVYFILYGVILLIIIASLYYVISSEENKRKKIDEEAKNNRLIIEKLEDDKKKYYVNSEREGEYSFYNRNIVDEVLAVMSDEDKEKCIQVDIFVENLKMEHFVLITAILGRIKEGRSISCYWEENQFKVLLFHNHKEEVQGFIDLFISKYKTDSQEKVEELKIVASRLV